MQTQKMQKCGSKKNVEKEVVEIEKKQQNRSNKIKNKSRNTIKKEVDIEI